VLRPIGSPSEQTPGPCKATQAIQASSPELMQLTVSPSAVVAAGRAERLAQRLAAALAAPSVSAAQRSLPPSIDASPLRLSRPGHLASARNAQHGLGVGMAFEAASSDHAALPAIGTESRPGCAADASSGAMREPACAAESNVEGEGAFSASHWICNQLGCSIQFWVSDRCEL
jgi:hypothetical protein